MKNRVSIIGSGNWGTAIATVIQKAIKDKTHFEPEIKMWTFEEMVDGKKLTEIINKTHENVKYLPGIKLDKSIVAVPDLEEAVKECNILVFVVPHQFIINICNQLKNLKSKIRKDAVGVSLIKGILVENDQIKLISDHISEELGIECGVLMGANIANEIGEGCISEGTLAYCNAAKCKSDKTIENKKCNDEIGKSADDPYKNLVFDTFNSYFYRVNFTTDKNGVEMCGTLKNIVSLAYGIGNGTNLKTNTKVAILRNGLLEMIKFCKMFYSDVSLSTFFESAGIADLFVSSLCGRNFKCGVDLGKNKTVKEIEDSMDGQKLQGTLTAKEIYGFLRNKKKENEFPLFVMVYKICYENESCASILEVIPKK